MGRLNAIAAQYSSSRTSGNIEIDLASLLNTWQLWSLIPEAEWVDPIRKITSQSIGNEPAIRGGSGLIAQLADLQNPGHENYKLLSAKFGNLQAFIRDVLDDQTARIEIPRDLSTILVHRHGDDVKPLDNVGTGISEVIFLAAVATITNGRLVCIEEPELHLHPTLQRKLIEYLSRETNNHYIISTHSASMLNSNIASISHIQKPDKWSIVSPVITPSELSSAVSDLGNRASDLVQSNFLIWVEGPADRLYVRHWINLINPELVEGAHYSIMFYGGALLSHLSVDDEETDDFIQLLKINRNLCVVIDSDKSSASDSLNATKERIISELESIDAFPWITEGYTIENYVPIDQLQSIIDELYPDKAYVVEADRYKSPIGHSFDAVSTKPSKVTVARHVVDRVNSLDDWPQDIHDKITVLATRIKDANKL